MKDFLYRLIIIVILVEEYWLVWLGIWILLPLNQMRSLLVVEGGLIQLLVLLFLQFLETATLILTLKLADRRLLKIQIFLRLEKFLVFLI